MLPSCRIPLPSSRVSWVFVSFNPSPLVVRGARSWGVWEIRPDLARRCRKLSSREAPKVLLINSERPPLSPHLDFWLSRGRDGHSRWARKVLTSSEEVATVMAFSLENFAPPSRLFSYLLQPQRGKALKRDKDELVSHRPCRLRSKILRMKMLISPCSPHPSFWSCRPGLGQVGEGWGRNQI